jgi:hypothetical protein
MWPGPIQAHDIYMGLLSTTGLPCCNNTDCRPAHFRVTHGGVQMFIDEQWIEIAHNKVQYRALAGDRGETGGGHWCGSLHPRGYFTRCAILPPRSASATHLGPR